jgi:hypothetical protein
MEYVTLVSFVQGDHGLQDLMGKILYKHKQDHNALLELYAHKVLPPLKVVLRVLIIVFLE